jgi:hypothetical protein
MLSADARRTFAALADVLIPAGEGMPAASEVDVGGKWLDRALRARPDLETTLERVLADAEGRDPSGETRRLHAEDAEGFAALAHLAAGAYTMHAKVRKRLGYPGQKSNPPFPDEAEYYLEEGLLDPVLALAPFGRQIPAADPAPPRPQIPKPRGPRPEVLVIGAGAAGSVAAKHLAEAGFSVVCLEQGGWRSAGEFPGDKLEFELLVEKDWNADPNVRARPEDYPTECSESDIAPVMSTPSAARRFTSAPSGRACVQSTSRCARRRGSATTGPSRTRRCSPSTSGWTPRWGSRGGRRSRLPAGARRLRCRPFRSGRSAGRRRKE